MKVYVSEQLWTALPVQSWGGKSPQMSDWPRNISAGAGYFFIFLRVCCACVPVCVCVPFNTSGLYNISDLAPPLLSYQSTKWNGQNSALPISQNLFLLKRMRAEFVQAKPVYEIKRPFHGFFKKREHKSWIGCLDWRVCLLFSVHKSKL